MNHEAHFGQTSPFHLPMSPMWLLCAHVWSASKTSSSVKSSASFAKVAIDLMNGGFVHLIHFEAKDPLGEYWWMAWTLWRLRLVVLSHIRLMSSVKPIWDWSYFTWYYCNLYLIYNDWTVHVFEVCASADFVSASYRKLTNPHITVHPVVPPKPPNATEPQQRLSGQRPVIEELPEVIWILRVSNKTVEEGAKLHWIRFQSS